MTTTSDRPRFEAARLQYKPAAIRYLFVAEAPPGEERFFYFEDVSTHDNLFLETMKVLYPDFPEARIARSRKKEFLKRFQVEGFHLIDAVAAPIEGRGIPTKLRAITDGLPNLQKRIHELVDGETWIILISASVYRVCARPFQDGGLRVGNSGPIEFPSSGWQREFRRKLADTLSKCYASNAEGSHRPRD